MKKINYDLIIFPLLIILSAVLILVMIHNDRQSTYAMTMKVTFQGEYLTESGSLQPITNDSKLAFNSNGEVCLKGYFQIEAPDGTVIGRPPKDINMIAYFDHIGSQININGEPVHIFDMENKEIGISACGESWIKFNNPADEDDTIELIFRDPHKYGNSGAVNTFLESLYIYPGAYFDEQMLQKGAAQRTTGIVIIVVSFIMLGVAIFSTILKVPYSRLIRIFGFLLMSAGAFCVIDSPNFCLCGNSVILCTTIKHLCIILYPMCLFLLTAMFLNEKVKKAGEAAAGIYGILSSAAVIIAIFGEKPIYDLNFYLMLVRLAAIAILIALSILSLKGSDKKHIIIKAVCPITLLALGTDISAVLMGVWNTAVVSKAVFAAVFFCALFYSFRIIPLNIKASIHAKELQLELQENKVAIMLSRIQPHFLYNVLSAICDMCGSEPLKARDALVDFSVYLRENMDSLGSSEPVAFEQELSHIKTYIKLEKMRFEDKINVIYDILTDDFKLRPLTIQPIVENAVKHGICKKENGGTITLRTFEENGIITITVADDGVGFDVNSSGTAVGPHSHIGLENVRKRVENLPEGKFTIESEKGRGTVVTISFRK